MIARPWPPPKEVTDLPCTCEAEGVPAESRCNSDWIRCNTRLGAIRTWQWDEEERLGVAHPEGVTDPRADEQAGGGS